MDSAPGRLTSIHLLSTPQSKTPSHFDLYMYTQKHPTIFSGSTQWWTRQINNGTWCQNGCRPLIYSNESWMFWFCVWLAGLTPISCLLPWLLPCLPTRANHSSVACSSRQFTRPTLKLLHPIASLPMVDPLLFFTCWWMTYMHVVYYVCGSVMMIT